MYVRLYVFVEGYLTQPGQHKVKLALKAPSQGINPGDFKDPVEALVESTASYDGENSGAVEGFWPLESGEFKYQVEVTGSPNTVVAKAILLGWFDPIDNSLYDLK